MSERAPDITVAGHICLDVIPDLTAVSGGMAGVCVPGKLTNVGPVALTTGGAVPNVGLALHRLGFDVSLMGKIGADGFGSAVLEILRGVDPRLADGMVVADAEQTSYTIVLSPPGDDRAFLHCPGANDSFAAEDVAYDRLSGTRLFHFGYPPLMRRMFAEDGRELADLLARVKRAGPVVCLDVAWPDPHSEAGRVDWPRLLSQVLPQVDVFAPSLDEILFMLDPSGTGAPDELDAALLAGTAERLIDMGTPIVALKLGSEGIYLKTTSDAAVVAALALGPEWRRRELLAPCFQVDVVGATGAGDCTIAGLVAGILRGQGPGDALTTAVAVGACNCEAPDATSGLLNWDATQARIRGGWARRRTRLGSGAWRWDERTAMWFGPSDS